MDILSRTTWMKLIMSLCVAEVVFAMMYFGLFIYTHYRPLTTGQDVTIFLVDLVAYLAWIVSGYVAARMFKSHMIPMGIAAGLLASVIVALYEVIRFNVHTALLDGSWLVVYGAILGGIGGLIRTLQALVMRFTRPGEQIK